MSDNDKIINFTKELSDKSKNSKVKISSPSVTYSKLVMDEWSYKCPYCDEVITFNSENMIFRVIELYCAICGNFHKISNPAFIVPTNKLKK